MLKFFQRRCFLGKNDCQYTLRYCFVFIFSNHSHSIIYLNHLILFIVKNVLIISLEGYLRNFFSIFVVALKIFII